MKRLITACHFAAAQALLHAASTPRRVATRREAYVPHQAVTVAGAANLAFYQLQMSRRERRGADSWRKTQAAARVDWCRHVFATEGWLYAVQTLRNGITTNTFLASTARGRRRAGAPSRPRRGRATVEQVPVSYTHLTLPTKA